MKKRRVVFSWCEKQNTDICFLQETHSTQEIETQWQKEWGNKIIFSHGKSNARGTCVLFKKSLDFSIQKQIIDGNGRFVLLFVSLNDIPYVLINIYAPNEESKAVDFFRKLKSVMNAENVDSTAKIIMGGDFNCALNPILDRRGTADFRAKIPLIQSIRELMEIFEIQDIWRMKNPVLKSFTWSNPTKNQFSRIDYWLVSSNLQDQVTKVDIKFGIKTDHSAITLSIINEEAPFKGPGFWKFNTSLLEDKNYVSEMKMLIEKLKHENEDQLMKPNTFWEWLKYNIRKHSIKFSKTKSRAQRKMESELEMTLQKAIKDLEEDPTDENKITVERLQKRLEFLYDEKVMGIIKRANIRYYEEGEKSTKYFLNLEKRNRVKKNMNKIFVNGQTVTDQKEIREAQYTFYKNLYTKRPTQSKVEDLEILLSEIQTPKLDRESMQLCEGKITEIECFEVLNTMNDDKSPGNDGISVEFYKHFWSSLKPCMVQSFNYSYDNNCLSTSQRQAVITLIEKKNTDRTDLKNWRPISLLNVDYKIMSKVIAFRLKKVLPSIISPCQTGYVKDRYIGEAVRLIEDVMDFADEEKIPGLLLFLDFEKAFDSVDWEFLQSTMTLFGFGPSLLRWFNLFYNDVSSCVLNNGFSTKYFNVQRGVRQGDPLSPYLFILGAEILSQLIVNNTNIKGIKLEKEVKLVQFADDTTIFLKDLDSAKEVFKTLNTFEKVSGLKINYHKTEAMWIGSEKCNTDRPLGLNWQNKVKALGVYFCHDKSLQEKCNFESILPEIESIINMWKQRKVTIFGKIALIKSLLLSKITYKATMFSVPQEFVKKLYKLVFNFLWNGPDKIKRNTVCGSYNSGGLQMTDIHNMLKSLKLSWVSRFLKDEEKPWTYYLHKKFQSVGGVSLFLKCNFQLDKHNIKLNNFYEDVLNSWKDFKTNLDILKYKDEILWNNKDFLVDNKPVFIKHFYDVGLVKVTDLIKSNSPTNDFAYWVRRGLEKTFSNYMRFISLRSAVNKARPSAKHNLNLSNENEEWDLSVTGYNGKKIQLSSFKSKQFYLLLEKDRPKTLPTGAIKLKEHYLMSDEELMKHYRLMFKIALEPKLREFQYKQLHFILNTNLLLKKKNIVESEKCEFCNTENETIYHLFYNCIVVKTFWSKVAKYWIEVTKNTKLELKEKDIILGNLEFSDLLNFVVILGKSYIFITKNKKTCPQFEEFIVLLKDKYKLEESLARKNNKKINFRKRWSPLTHHWASIGD